MRVAALADIHGNLPALEAVLADVEREEVDAIVVAGDSFSGPWPIYTRITPDDQVVAVLGSVDHDVLVCGHTHMQYDRTLSTGLRVVNPGSVGMPYEGQRGAFWAVLGPDVEFRRSDYDVDATVAAIEVMGAPIRAELFRQLLEPPTSDETTLHFESLRGA